MQLSTLDSLNDIAAVDWDALQTESNPFVSHAFLSALEDSCCVGHGSGWQVAHRVLHDVRGALVAAMPGYIKSHSYGEYVFDMSWAEACHRAGIAYYPKLLCAAPFSPVTGPRLLGSAPAVQALLTAVEADLAGLSSVHVNFVREQDNGLFEGREPWLARLDCQFHWLNHGYRDFADFLEALTSRKRKQMRKEREQVRAQGIECERWRGDQLSEADWDFVYSCYARTYLVRGRQPYLNRLFFSLWAQRMGQQLQVIIASQAGVKVAMALYVEAQGVLYGRYWGCLDDFDRLHFETCFYQGIDYAIRAGLSRFDAGAQGEHKLVRGFEPHLTRSWHYLRHPGLRAAVAAFLQQERPAVLAYLQQAREQLPFRQNGA